MSAAIEQRNQDATVYVGNLDDRVSEELLWELMLQAGSVCNVHMPRDKITGAHQNYGFVEFRTEECAEYAVKVLNMIQLYGKVIRVKKASNDKKNLDVGANLFLGNLDPEVDEKLLYDTFSAFGGIIETPKIMRDPDTKTSRGFGFVSFDSFEAADLAIECMHGQYLCNRQVVVQYAFKKDSHNERHGSEAERLLAQRNPNKLKPHTMFAFTAANGGAAPAGVTAMQVPPPPPQFGGATGGYMGMGGGAASTATDDGDGVSATSPTDGDDGSATASSASGVEIKRWRRLRAVAGGSSLVDPVHFDLWLLGDKLRAMASTNQEEAVRGELSWEYLIERLRLDGGALALKPAKRGGATLTQVEETGAVYLIGGANREGTSFGDVHRFNVDARRWILVTPSSGSLPPRSGHSAVAIGEKIYIFGGLDAAEGQIYGDVHIFNTRTSSWTNALTEGENPLPRNAHAAIALPEQDGSEESQRMLVYGGSSPEYGAFNDVYLLQIHDETTTLMWEKRSTSGELPEARELHCALMQSGNTICFAGGRNFDGKVCTDMALLDCSNWVWQLVPICEWNRCSLAAGVLNGELVAFGGWNGGQICGDCCRYSDDEESWLPVIVADSKNDKQPAEPSPSEIPERFGHCGTTVSIQAPLETVEKTRCQGFLVFGGMNAESDLNDLVLITQTQLTHI